MSMFVQRDALQAFRAFLNGRGLNEATVPFRDGFEAMLDFYEAMRASDCTSESADMLLFQWGTNDRAYLPRGDGTGVAFDINLVRQLIPDVQEDDDDIWQLELNFELEPTDKLRALGRDNRWCSSLQDLREFRDYVLTSQPFKACSELPVRRRMLEYQCAG
jgi:hypothetical protein